MSPSDALDSRRWSDRLAYLRDNGAKLPVGSAARILALTAGIESDLDSSTGTPELMERRSLAHAELGALYLALGRLERAAELSERAGVLAPPGLSAARGRAEHVAGRVAQAKGELTTARTRLESATRIARHLGDHVAEAAALDDLGELALRTLDTFEAEHFFKESLALRNEHDDKHGQAEGLTNLGSSSLLRGDADQALEYFYRGRSLSRDLGEHMAVAAVCRRIAEVWLRMGDPARAAEAIAEGTDAAAKSADPRDAPRAQVMLGRIHLERDDARAAFEQISAGLARLSQLGATADALEAQLRLGMTLRQLGRLDEAVLTIDTVADGCKAADLPELRAEALAELAATHHRRGDAPARRAALEEGLDLARHSRAPAIRQRLEADYAFAAVGEKLIEASVLDEATLARVLEASRRKGVGLGRMLVREGILDSAKFEAVLRALGYRRIVEPNLGRAARKDAVRLLPRRTADRILALPLMVRAQEVHVAMADPLDFRAREDIRLATTLKVVPLYVPEAELEKAIEEAWSGIDFHLEQYTSGAPAVERMIAAAAALGASDIHIEPKLGRCRVRARVDGVLHEVDQIDQELGTQIVSRLKIMAGLDIAEKRLPQDGRARYAKGLDQKSLRISTLPSIHGEKAVIRLLEQGEPLRLDELGLDDSAVGVIRRLIARKEGLFLVVGPTGSGKSTTLYAALSEIDSLEKSITTVEDPVEYESAGFTQTQVGGGGAVLTFAEALKAILRQDPDVVLLGEMRDIESGSIATRLALTGCLVVSSLHAYDSTTAVVRLIEMGIPAYVCVAVMRVVLAQRLVRRLCPYCKVAESPDAAHIRALDPSADMAEVLARGSFKRAVGCDKCSGIGYRGRVPVFELLEMDTELRELLSQTPSAEAFRRAAIGRGLRTMQTSALRRAMAGETSLAEVLRVM